MQFMTRLLLARSHLLVATLLGVAGVSSASNAAAQSVHVGSVADSSFVGSDSGRRLDDESVHGYLVRTIGPLAFIKAAAVAGVEQSFHSPPEWPRNGRGYADRYGSSLAGGAIASTVRFGLANALHERVGDFEPCRCSDFLPRLGHATATPFHAYTAAGPRLSLLTPLSELVSGLLTTTVRPGGFNARDGLRNGAIGLAATAGVAVVHEFWPLPWSLGRRLNRQGAHSSATTDHVVSDSNRIVSAPSLNRNY